MSSMSFAPASHGFGASSSAAADDASSLSLTAQLQRIFAFAASPPAPQPPSTSASSSSSSSSAVAAPPDPAVQLLRAIQDAQQLAASLELISQNDRLADLSTNTLRPLLLPAVLGEVLTRVRTPVGEHAGRMELLRRSRDAWRLYLLSLLQLGVLPAPSATSVGLGLLTSQARAHLSTSGPPKLDAANRRALKIALLQLERGITRALDAHREAARDKARAKMGGGLKAQREGVERGASAALEAPEEAQWDLLVLPRVARGMVNSGGGDGESDESSDEEQEDAPGGLPSAGGPEAVAVPRTTRGYVLLLLALHASKALAALDSIGAELELLQSMPAATAAGRAEGSRERGRDGADAQAWRLDRRLDASAPGALLDAKGKVLRPFQITGASASSGASRNPMGTLADDGMNKREELRRQVFQPGHRLPTMSIDEFLDEEERRGNIITGGGPEGAARATPREARALRMENDGTREADEAEEEARQEAMQWDTFKEHNRRGEGNTMNRG